MSPFGAGGQRYRGMLRWCWSTDAAPSPEAQPQKGEPYDCSGAGGWGSCPGAGWSSAATGKRQFLGEVQGESHCTSSGVTAAGAWFVMDVFHRSKSRKMARKWLAVTTRTSRAAQEQPRCWPRASQWSLPKPSRLWWPRCTPRALAPLLPQRREPSPHV